MSGTYKALEALRGLMAGSQHEVTPDGAIIWGRIVMPRQEAMTRALEVLNSYAVMDEKGEQKLVSVCNMECDHCLRDGRCHASPRTAPAPSAAEPVTNTVSVERAWLENLKAMVNTLAVLSLKPERWSLAIDIKQSIADVLAVSKDQP